MAEHDFMEILKRHRKNIKIGLALSSGAAKGEAHVGVLKAIIEKEIPISVIAGTSAGAIVGAYFASRGNVDGLEEYIYNVKPKEMTDMMSLELALQLKGFIGEEKSLKWLKGLIGGVYFSDLKIPLAIVTTDMNSGEQIIIRKGSVLEAVRASMAMPVIFTPTRSQSRFLVDGGFSNPLPVDVAKNMGATFVIASNVTRTPEVVRGEFKRSLNYEHDIVLSKELEKARKELMKDITEVSGAAVQGEKDDIPNMLNVLTSAVYSMEWTLAKAKMREADITISPDLQHIGMLDFYRGREVVAKGYEAASKVLSKFINRLKFRHGLRLPFFGRLRRMANRSRVK
jgi:NTE family protein